MTIGQDSERGLSRWRGAGHAVVGAVLGGLGIALAGRALLPALFGGAVAITVWLLLVIGCAVGVFGVLDWWFSARRRVARSVVLGMATAAVWAFSTVACVAIVAGSGSAALDPLNPPPLVLVGGAGGVAVFILLRYRGWTRLIGIVATGAALLAIMVASFQAKTEDDLSGLQSYFGSTLRPYVSPIDGYDEPALVGHGAKVLAFYAPTGQDAAGDEGAKTILLTTEQFMGAVADSACAGPMRSSATAADEAEIPDCEQTEQGWIRSNESSIELIAAVEGDVLLRVSAGRVVPVEALEAVLAQASPMEDDAYLSELHRVCNGCLEAGW